MEKGKQQVCVRGGGGGGEREKQGGKIEFLGKKICKKNKNLNGGK